MPLEYKIEHGIVFIKNTGGAVTVQQQKAFTRRWLADPDLPTPLLVCRDYHGSFARTPAMMREFSQFWMSVVPNGTRAVLVVSGDLDFGMAKVFRGWAGSSGINVLRDRDEAIKWLRSGSR